MCFSFQCSTALDKLSEAHQRFVIKSLFGHRELQRNALFRNLLQLHATDCAARSCAIDFERLTVQQGVHFRHLLDLEWKHKSSLLSEFLRTVCGASAEGITHDARKAIVARLVDVPCVVEDLARTYPELNGADLRKFFIECAKDCCSSIKRKRVKEDSDDDDGGDDSRCFSSTMIVKRLRKLGNDCAEPLRKLKAVVCAKAEENAAKRDVRQIIPDFTVQLTLTKAMQAKAFEDLKLACSLPVLVKNREIVNRNEDVDAWKQNGVNIVFLDDLSREAHRWLSAHQRSHCGSRSR